MTDIDTLSPLGPTDGNTMLGIFEDPRQPDRIIKMVSVNDGYFGYAAWLLANYWRSPHFLKVYAIEMLDEKRALVTVERLEDGHELDWDQLEHLSCILGGFTTDRSAPPTLCKAVQILYSELGKFWTPDLHTGNYMTRPSNGTVVINDPFHRRLNT